MLVYAWPHTAQFTPGGVEQPGCLFTVGAGAMALFSRVSFFWPGAPVLWLEGLLPEWRERLPTFKA